MDVNRTVDKLAQYSWRLLVIAAAGLAAILLLVRLRVVLFPIIIATFLSVALTPVARVLRSRGLPKLPAAALAFLLFFSTLVGVFALIVPTVADEIGDVGPTLTEATDSIEAWLIEDIGIEASQIERWRNQASSAVRSSASGSGSTEVVLDGAVLVGEAFAGLLLSLFLAFFMVKDGERFQAFLLRQLPEDRRPLARRLAARGWRTLAGYLRGSAALGVVEGAIIGITMAIVGGSLIPAVMTITFLAAFIPFLGAIIAGVVAVAVTFVTAGAGPAAVVAIVALVVQQLDNDLLAPIVFGKALELHPVAILLGVATGAALGGLPAAILAVPITALISNLASEARHPRLPELDEVIEPGEVFPAPQPG
ncbi:MAG TPA: AI-2E family transporter [Acidimicrobiales bacterium]|nr:AI-2E family transporter [Acidimicrobiales bacterium]